LHSNVLAISVYASYCTLHPMYCIIIFLAHVWLISLVGHMYAKLELDVPTEQIQVAEFTNLVLTQDKPRCINQYSLSFILNISLYFT
jgi:hypothetical protein